MPVSSSHLRPTIRDIGLVAAFLLTMGSVAQRAAGESSLPSLARPEGSGVDAGITLSEAAFAPEDLVRARMTNGLDITLYPSDVLASKLTWVGNEPVIPLDGGQYLSVIVDIEDPAIANKGDGSFHPFSEAEVLEVLAGISHPGMDFALDVYVLPYPRRNVLVSSASGTTIFLSPHVLDINPVVCAYIVAHELGHVFQNVYLAADAPAWRRYRQIRGIADGTKFYDTAAHAYRPSEIFAEDFRVLFGGSDAALGGRVENPELPSPTVVAGLGEFIARIGGAVIASRAKVHASSHPNPFNPETEIRVVIPEEVAAVGDRVTVRIYDVRGALITELYSGVTSEEILVARWDGHDRYGNAVTSGNYFASIEAGPYQTTLKLVLLK